MKPFSSSILSSNSYRAGSISSLQESVDMNTLSEYEESRLVKLLQFNEAAAEANLNSTREFYLNLLKMCNKESKSFDPAFAAIFNRFDGVVTAANMVVNEQYKSSRLYDNSDILKVLDNLRDTSTDVTLINSITTRPDKFNSSMFAMHLEEYCKKGVESLGNGTFSQFAKEVSIDQEDIFKFLSSMVRIDESHSIDEFVKNYDAKFELDKVTVGLYNCRDILCGAHYSITDIGYPGDYISSAIGFVQTLKSSVDMIDDINDLRKVIGIICDTISTYVFLFSAVSGIIDEKANYVYEYNRKAVLDAFHSCGAIKESMSMFGDEYTYQSVFDDLDAEDFNPTEFMDLNLVSESIYKMDVMDAKRYGIALEARLLAEGKYDELYTINEAIGQKIKDGVGKIVEFIKTIMAKFMESMTNIFAPEKVYLQKYKNIILNSTLPPETTIQFEGHAIEAMRRLREGFKIPTASYAELSQKPEQFESAEAFFNRNKSTLLGQRQTEFKDIEDAKELTNKLKVFFGYKDDENKPESKTFKELDIKEIYNFLVDTEKDLQKMRNESKNIERTYNNYVSSSKKFDKPISDKDSKENVNASFYYSPLNDKFMSIGERTTVTTPDNSPATAKTDDGKPAETNNTELTRDQTDDEVKKAGGDPEGKIARAMEIYCTVCRNFLSARITGYQYCHKELMDVIRAIVKAKLGNKADIKKDNTAQQEENKTPQKQKAAVAKKK